MGALLTNPLRSFTDTTSRADRVDNLLGRVFEGPSGARYKLIQAQEALAAGDVVAISTTADDAYSVDQSNANSIPCGVATAAMALDDYGFAQVAGLADVNAISTVAAGQIAYAAASGEAASVAVTSLSGAQALGALGVVLTAPVYSATAQLTAAKVFLKGLN